MRRDELIGRTIANRFRIQRVLGEGGMATVFVAEQPGEPREVALKVLHAELSRDRTFAKRFQREASAAARVKHPNSVTIFDAGVEGDLSYIAMELLPGDDLYTLLERHRALSPRDAATIVAEVCDALAVAHALGIVHRDLKPENIMIMPDPSAPRSPNGPALPPGARVKVLDFGIAKLLDTSSDAPRPGGGRLDPPSQVTAVTRVGTMIGTPAYMSPEQCAMLAVDTRSDIYTCGILLFQMLTGRLPFEGPTPLHIATKHLHNDAPTLRSVVPEADAALDALIAKALAKKPGDRHPTAKHLGASLRRLLPSLPDRPYVQDEPTLIPGSLPLIGRGVSLDVSLDSLEVPEPIASAKTVVADGLSGSPASIVVHDTERPPSSAVESEPEDLARTLVRELTGDEDTEDLETTRETGPPGLTDRQMTMQSLASNAPPERPGRISVVDPPPLPPAPPARGSAPERAGRGSAPDIPAFGDIGLGLPSGAQSVGPAARFSPVPPAPGRSSVPSGPPAHSVTVPQGTSLAPAPPAQFAPTASAPTFGLPRVEAPPPAATALTARALWLGIFIGAVVSAVLFVLAYLLLLKG